MSGKAWTPKRIEQAKAALRSSTTIADAAAKLGVDRGSFAYSLRQHGVEPGKLLRTEDPIAIERTRLRQAADAREVKRLKQRVVEAEEASDFWTSLHRMPTIKPVLTNRSRPKSGKRPGTPVDLCSDLHCGEVVTEAETLGRNSYDLAEFDRRMGNWTDNVLYLRKRTRLDVTADDHVLALNGDMVSGSIHPELTETNEVETIDQVYHCAEKVLPVIHALSADCRRVIIPCIGGNHGRNSLKSQLKNGWAHNLETHLFRYLQQATTALENVEWHIPRADHLVLDVMGHRVRQQHGTHIKSQGGVGGILVPLSRWAMRTGGAGIFLFGHFHQACYFPAGEATIIVNGSLIGDSAYSSLLGLSFRPPEQVSFLIDERRGVRGFQPVSVT